MSKQPDLIAILGDGISARCCTRLLERSGIRVSVDTRQRSGNPAVMLSEATLNLLNDCLGERLPTDQYHPITRRIVAWGDNDAVSIKHSGIALGAHQLNKLLPQPVSGIGADTAADFRVFAATPFPESSHQSFGKRIGSSAEVVLLCKEESNACWIESLDSGWIFLIPTAHGQGWLLGVGAELDTLLSRSRYLQRRVVVAQPARAIFETAPRMLNRLSGPNWLACGTQAIAFDPICGDGTGQAAREAILAAAVIQALADRDCAETSCDKILTHYHSLLLASMRRHLRLCAQFYTSGGCTPWWQQQVSDLIKGFEWCSAQLEKLPEPKYELHNFRLIPR